MLICSPGKSYNEGTIIRYNLSQNDGLNSARVFHISGVKDSLIHNNTIYVGTNQSLPFVIFNEWAGGIAENTRFVKNQSMWMGASPTTSARVVGPYLRTISSTVTTPILLLTYVL